jgi:nuclear transcription Y subunit beta
MKDKRKTISGEDVLHSLNLLGYENYMKALTDYMNKYREVVKEAEEAEEMKD